MMNFIHTKAEKRHTNGTQLWETHKLYFEKMTSSRTDRLLPVDLDDLALKPVGLCPYSSALYYGWVLFYTLSSIVPVV